MKHDLLFSLQFAAFAIGLAACAPKFNFNPTLQGTEQGCSGNPTFVTLSSIYPLNGRNWMDWVHVSDTTKDSYSQTDTACAGTEAHEWDCIHGGEKLQVPIPQLSSCDGVTAQDSLGAFDWVCKVKSGEVYVFSEGLKEFKGLKDLINAAGTGFQENSVAVYQNGCEVASSQPGIWWGNTFSVLTSNAGAGLTSLGGAAGTIYTLPVSSATAGVVTTDGFNLNGNQQALVVMSGVTLRYSGTAGYNIFDTQGKPDGASNNQIAVVSSGSESFQWIEGTFDGLPSSGSEATTVVDTRGDNFISYRASTFENTTSGPDGGQGLLSWNCQSCAYENLTSVNNTGAGVFDDGGSGSFVKNIYAANNNGEGICFESSNLFVENVWTANNGEAGIHLGLNGTYMNLNSENDVLGVNNYSSPAAPTDNIVVGALVTSDGSYALQVYGDEDDTYLGLTMVNSGWGVYTEAPSAQNTYVNIAATNNDFGVELDGANSENFYEIASMDNQTGVQIQNSSTGSAFAGYLLVGNNSTASCTVSGAGASPGAVNGTCTSGGGTGAGSNGSGGSSANWGGYASTAYLYTGLTAVNSFVGKMTATDAANSTNANGAEAYSANLDWFDFSDIMRSWGLDGGTFPSSDNRGSCTSGTCRIWDWRLSRGDAILKNASGAGNLQNDSFIAGETCPQAVNGNTAITDHAGHTFLPNAYEITFDFDHNPTGNNNGLCESGEACIYMPNIGAYQGEGDPFSQAPCIFQNGAVSNVTMYAYPTNGD